MDVDHVTHTSNEPTHIPLTLIPTALQILDLPPADEEVLAVFENAARGWGGAQVSTGEEGVSREDFRAVCAALLPEEEDQEEGTDGDDGSVDEDEEPRGIGTSTRRRVLRRRIKPFSRRRTRRNTLAKEKPGRKWLRSLDQPHAEEAKSANVWTVTDISDDDRTDPDNPSSKGGVSKSIRTILSGRT
jgi:hypothetical protein